MSGLLASLKTDLLGRRLLPLVVLLGVALAGAVAYAVVGSGGSGSTTPVASLGPAAPTPAPSLASPAPANPNVAVSETTSGVHYQRGGATRDPFVKLPEPKKASTTPASSSGASSKGSQTASSGAGSSSGGSGGTKPTGPTNPNPEKPKKKVLQRTFQVAVLFGLAPPPGQNPQLVSYENLKRLTPLPDKEHAQLVYSGVSASGQGAIFTLLHEAIVKGGGICLPSATQCEMLDMPVGKTEELQYVGSEGQAVTYLLQVVSIVKHETTFTPLAARVNRLGAHGASLDNGRRVTRPRPHVHRRGLARRARAELGAARR
ncbi:MAG TPA: hypothetical protein VID70_08540 [Solirubrobacteraceae bacterium]|jgi:hypothetical protein